MPKPFAQSPTQAAIYARISRDREGAGQGVDRQEADCHALAERLGWEVVAVFIDNDVSAYSGAPRPQYRAMLDAVRAGEVQGVIAWHTDRLHRRATELEEFVTIAETHHLQVQTVTAGTVDLSSASGRMVARMLGAAAQHEVDHARERMKAAKRQMAENGRYRGGMRPYGFDDDGRTIREAEAAVIRDATRAILAGRTLAGVARELNEQGRVAVRERKVKNESGARRRDRDAPRETYTAAWTYDALRDVLLRPRNAGLISMGRNDRPDSLVIEGKAEWEAIVKEDEWRALQTLLLDPARRRQEGNSPRWLGSGLYRCGKCGGPMRAAPHGGTPSQGGRGRKYHYRCTNEAHLTVAAARTDEYVLGVVAEMVRDPRVVAAMHPGNAHLTADRERRSALAARLDSFVTDYASGRITGAQLQKATATVTAELAEVDARLAKGLRRSSMAGVMRAADPGAAFLAAPVDVQRAVLGTVLSVEILPTAVRGAAWNPDRVRLTPVT